MPRVYVSLGSNIDRQTHLRTAVHELSARYGKLVLSPVYESPAAGFDGGDFYNLVAGFDTEEPPQRVKEFLKAIETRCGRRRDGPRFGPRTLDLDLILYGDIVRHDGLLDLPHPDIQRYAFVLRPLADIAPEQRHPETQQSYAQMWTAFDPARRQLRKVEFDPTA
jgi:2-amino-4-hydroxy-6-hydroxymethyldihydropteridine diphosphokinase